MDISEENLDRGLRLVNYLSAQDKADLREKIGDKILEEAGKKLLEEGWEYGKGGRPTIPVKRAESTLSCESSPIKEKLKGYGEGKEWFWDRMSIEEEKAYGQQLKDKARKRADAILDESLKSLFKQCESPCHFYLEYGQREYKYKGPWKYESSLLTWMTWGCEATLQVTYGCKQPDQ